MTRKEASLRWNEGRRKFRERIARHMPETLTFFPFEVVVAAMSLIIGIPLLLGLAAPASLVLLLPQTIYWFYSIALVLGGSTVAVGLKLKSPNSLISGLRLVGGSFAIYAIAVVAIAGWFSAFAAFAAFMLLGAVCFVRAHHFRRLTDIQAGATRLVKQ